MAVQSFFTPDRFPPGSPDNWAETSDRTFGNAFQFGTDGTVTEIGVYGPTSNPPTSWKVKAFDQATQALLAGKVAAGTMGAGVWNWVVLDTPLGVVAGVTYVFSYYMNGAGNYALTEGVLTTAQTNGDITVLADGGRFTASSVVDAYPAGPFNGLWFVDVKFTAAGGAPPSVVVLAQTTRAGEVQPVRSLKSKTLELITRSGTVSPVDRSKLRVLGQIERDAQLFPVASPAGPKVQVLAQIVRSGLVMPIGAPVTQVHTIVDLAPRFTEVDVLRHTEVNL